MGRDAEAPLDETKKLNMQVLLERVNKLIAYTGFRNLTVRSGYRTPAINTACGGSKNSAHLTCEAVDLTNDGGHLANELTANNAKLLTMFNLYMEDPTVTPTWVHLTTRAPKSKRRIFKP